MRALVTGVAVSGVLATLVAGAVFAAAHASPDDPRAGPAGIPTSSAVPAGLPPIRHVFVLVLENQSFSTTFGKPTPAPYLANTLPSKGALMTHYYGIGHWSLDNYLALISGQAPNSDTQADCPTLTEFQLNTPKLDANGQALGKGCIYPTIVRTLMSTPAPKSVTSCGMLSD